MLFVGADVRWPARRVDAAAHVECAGRAGLVGAMGEFGNLPPLSLETYAQGGSGVGESWAVIADGSLQHRSTNIQINEFGLRDKSTVFSIDQKDIEVDHTNLLGRGAGGVVALGKHMPTGTPLAVKVVRLEDKEKRSQLVNELQNLLRIAKSPFLIQLYTAYVHKDTGCVHVAIEYMDYGSLANVRSKSPKIPENMLALIMMQVLEGLKILHMSQVVHRDVKLENTLVNSAGFVKVTDFGISKKLGDADFCDTFVGTQIYMSPERVKGDAYSFAADIWSLGLCVYELAAGKNAYGRISSYPVLFHNLVNEPEPRLPKENHSPELCDFTARHLQRAPERRATAIQLQAHAWILDNMAAESQLVSWLRGVMDNQ